MSVIPIKDYARLLGKHAGQYVRARALEIKEEYNLSEEQFNEMIKSNITLVGAGKITKF